MTSLSLTSQFNVDPLVIVQKHQIKHCQGCHYKSLEKREFKPNSANNPIFKFLHQLDKREEFQFCYLANHHYGVPHKLSIIVVHIPNHQDCYNYRLEAIKNVFVESITQENTREPINHTCPGHYGIGKRFSILTKAEKKGQEIVKAILANPNYEEASFEIFDKQTASYSKKEKYFNVILPKRYFLAIYYKHFDSSRECPDHPRNILKLLKQEKDRE